MKAESIQIDRAGRIVLPKAVRDKFNLSAGDKLRLDVDEAGIHLAPSLAAGKLIREGTVLVFTCEVGQPISNELINSMLEEDRSRGVKEFVSMAKKR
jgi:AbrB family looped-hinge helix DNA binding protein